MKKKVFKILVLAVVLVLGVLINSFFSPMGFVHAMTEKSDLLKNTKDIKALKNIEFINGIYGLYNGSNNHGVIHVVQGKDENHFYIYGEFYKQGIFKTDDLKIMKNENNEIMVTEKIYPDKDDMGWLYCYFTENQSLEYVQMDIIIKDNKINLVFNNNTNWEFKKVDVKCITEETKNDALANILYSNFSNIDKDIFEIVHDTENYLVVIVKSHVLVGNTYETEGSLYGMYKYYNIEKKTKKILELNDIIKNPDDLNKYIIDSIEANRDKWIAEGRDNYREFERIGKYEWFENYFEIDEDRHMVKIRCLRYPCEVNRDIGDLNLDVPFSFFKLNGYEK